MLADDAFQDHGKHGPCLCLLLRRKHVDQAMDGCRSRAGVKGRKGQMSRFRDAKGCLSSFRISHLSHQHNIRVLSQSHPQGRGKGRSVGRDLPLIDDARPVPMEKLDGILDRNDVFCLLAS